MVFVRRAGGTPTRLGILPGTFNPVTVAHLALAGAAQSVCDEVLFVLPRVFPHKEYSGASLEQRIELLDSALHGAPAFSLAVADRGLFVEIAEECRQAYGAAVRLSFLCGRDAAERIASWRYDRPGAFAEMLRHFDLLVARRQGEYAPPAGLSARMERLVLPQEFDPVSATEVRERLGRGHAWEHLVPAAIRDRVRQIYRQDDAAIALD
ncbi:MAG TPA: adenylyltransferase/cytidyltransferase family protein [Bryobacteraceae bacterium]|nr:adenylyltransferase/cytidyltransferase family protein [Bryobacteraceae bacterium]